MRKYRVYSQEFKEAVSRRLVKGESVSAVHDELQIGLSVLYRWRDAYRKEGAAGLRPTGGESRCRRGRGSSGSPSWSARLASKRWIWIP